MIKLKTLLNEASLEKKARAAEDFIGKMVAKSPFARKVYVVGGAVRDQLRGNNPKDIDIVVAKKDGGIKFAEWITKEIGKYKRGSNPVVYPKFGTAKFQLYGVIHNGVDIGDLEIEAVMTRTEKYERGNRKPEVDYGSIKQDAKRRDLTFNAIYKQIDTGKIVDPLGIGIQDLQNNIARTTDDPDVIFKDDPLRMLRAIRFSVRDGSKLPMYLIRALKKNHEWIKTISAERIREELNKILKTPDAWKGLKLLELTKLMKHLFGDIYIEYDAHKRVKTGPTSHLAILLRDGSVKKLLKRLKYTNEEIGEVESILNILPDLQEGGVSDATIRKHRLEFGDEIFSKAVDCHVALGGDPSIKSRWKNVNIKVKKPLNGNDIIDLFDFKKGNKEHGIMIGKILRAVNDEWLENPTMSKEQAIQIANNKYHELTS